MVNADLSMTCQDSPVRSAGRSAWHAGPRLIVGAGSPKGQASSREGGVTSPDKQSNMGTGGNPGRAEESLTALMRMVYAASNASASSSNPVPLTASPSNPAAPNLRLWRISLFLRRASGEYHPTSGH